MPVQIYPSQLASSQLGRQEHLIALHRHPVSVDNTRMLTSSEAFLRNSTLC